MPSAVINTNVHRLSDPVSGALIALLGSTFQYLINEILLIICLPLGQIAKLRRRSSRRTPTRNREIFRSSLKMQKQHCQDIPGIDALICPVNARTEKSTAFACLRGRCDGCGCPERKTKQWKAIMNSRVCCWKKLSMTGQTKESQQILNRDGFSTFFGHSKAALIPDII
jgi:hypothetical protein